MRQILALDIAVFQSFDAVHACFSERASETRKTQILGLRLVPHVI
jgi:hypothetical protein